MLHNLECPGVPHQQWLISIFEGSKNLRLTMLSLNTIENLWHCSDVTQCDLRTGIPKPYPCLWDPWPWYCGVTCTCVTPYLYLLWAISSPIYSVCRSTCLPHEENTRLWRANSLWPTKPYSPFRVTFCTKITLSWTNNGHCSSDLRSQSKIEGWYILLWGIWSWWGCQSGNKTLHCWKITEQRQVGSNWSEQ